MKVMFRRRPKPDHEGKEERQAYGVHWLDSSENPWTVPVLDVRPVTLGMISTTTDPAMARNAISFRGDTGISFADASVPNPRRTPAHLRYATGGYLADGVLFIADQMEHKWAVFFHRDRLLFVRSWLRELHVAAHVRRGDGYVEIEQIEGVFTSVDEPPALTEAIMDFIVRSHVLGLVHPAPLAIAVGDDLDGAGLWCFSMFGNLAWYATLEPLVLVPPDQVLRSYSLLHIAVACNDRAGAAEQLDAGVPIDLRAGDGQSALHWALTTPDTGMLEWLVGRGLAVDTRTDEGATALMLAVQHEDVDDAAWLLDHGADPDATDDRAFTSLHRAAEMGHTDQVRLLLERGATRDPIAQGHTPLALAKARGHKKIVAALNNG